LTEGQSQRDVERDNDETTALEDFKIFLYSGPISGLTIWAWPQFNASDDGWKYWLIFLGVIFSTGIAVASFFGCISKWLRTRISVNVEVSERVSELIGKTIGIVIVGGFYLWLISEFVSSPEFTLTNVLLIGIIIILLYRR
jgi:hypothetical protein